MYSVCWQKCSILFIVYYFARKKGKQGSDWKHQNRSSMVFKLAFYFIETIDKSVYKP